jgi:hypothetical protein
MLFAMNVDLGSEYELAAGVAGGAHLYLQPRGRSPFFNIGLDFALKPVGCYLSDGSISRGFEINIRGTNINLNAGIGWRL